MNLRHSISDGCNYTSRLLDPAQPGWNALLARPRNLGVFRQGHIKSMSEQLQNCNITLMSVASIATLHSSLQQRQAAGGIKTMMLKQEAAVNDAITATNDQSAEVGAKLEALTLAEPNEGETDADQTGATR
ncbi:hypothetical protein B0T18DRAFT_391595 [Schizothecium vesticola]|uniref:Uncharacterized protein n=1 Tax=Schizothecium vesticola TaxID=314040 RepID=A0AA40ENN4_9PEZI|nr:hypothetical protein B0T18DRAFT_391595 [Schizothecium vesticola]